MPQTNNPTTIGSVKQIMKNNCKKQWLNDWTQAKTARRLFHHLPTPKPKDSLNYIERKYQTKIFRLRTGHSTLNGHTKRIFPQSDATCRHCPHPEETVEHHLLECPALQELRECLLPHSPTIDNTLYGDSKQLIRTAQYHILASKLTRDNAP